MLQSSIRNYSTNASSLDRVQLCFVNADKCEYTKGQWRPREWRVGFDGLQHGVSRKEVSVRVRTKSPSQVRTHYQKVKFKGVISYGSSNVTSHNGINTSDVLTENDSMMIALDCRGEKLPPCNGPFSYREMYLAVRAVFQWGLKPDKISWCLGTRTPSDVLMVLQSLENLAVAHGFTNERKPRRGRQNGQVKRWRAFNRIVGNPVEEHQHQPQTQTQTVQVSQVSTGPQRIPRYSRAARVLREPEEKSTNNFQWQGLGLYDAWASSPDTPLPSLFPELVLIQEKPIEMYR